MYDAAAELWQVRCGTCVDYVETRACYIYYSPWRPAPLAKDTTLDNTRATAQMLRFCLVRASELTTLPPAAGGAGGRRGDVWTPFWGAQQRFFKLLCVSLKIPTVIEEVGFPDLLGGPTIFGFAAAALECVLLQPPPTNRSPNQTQTPPRPQAKNALLASHCVVIGLQSTGEAATDAAGLEPGPVAAFVSTTRELLLRFVEGHFPVAREVSAEGGLVGDGVGV
jgi:hypothetical protein